MVKDRFLRILSLLAALSAVLSGDPFAARGEILLEDTVWEGRILVDEDIVVPEGITLTVKGNTLVHVLPSDSTKTDPEYMSPLTEITVRGNIRVDGSPEAPVVFRIDPAGESGVSWAGIIIDGGMAGIRSGVIRDAEAGLWVISGMVELDGSTLSSNRYGLVAQTEDSRVRITGSTVAGNEYGLMVLDGADVLKEKTTVTANERADFHTGTPSDPVEFKPFDFDFNIQGEARVLEDEVLMGDVIWQGRILIRGRVRVPAESRLIIMPGTIVEFTRNDTNGDGIGENGLMMQGVLIAKGTPEKPILFRSAEKVRRKGDWDSINIINSDGARNIVEYCQVEDAYRGLHFHFSNVAVQRSLFRNNFRGIQFQESTVELRKNQFHENTSGVQARDSEIILADNVLVHNISGANFLRSHLTVSSNRFGANLDFGLKIREGYPTVTANIIHHNRYGMMFSDTTYGRFSGNLVLHNKETGVSVRDGTNMEISGNFVQGNSISGISVRDAIALIRGNHVSENGERGIGVISFQGEITGNAIFDNGLYAIAAEDATDVSAPANWYGGDDVDTVIFDKKDEPGRGLVRYEPIAGEQPEYAWPLPEVPVDLIWAGKIVVPETVAVPSGVTLAVKPGAEVLFAAASGMEVQGRLEAAGTRDKRITFSGKDGHEPESWGEIHFEYAEGSRLSNCDFQYATWAVHSHFTALPVIGCTFSNNYGGIRFRSGPVLISSSLFRDNTIGIRAYLGFAEISGNIITGNAKGIFVREQGGGLTITGNNIFDNIDYNIWVGDFNKEDIRAAGNWWGMDDPAETFFDARREPGIGMVLYEPPLKAPLEIVIGDEMKGDNDRK